MSLLSEKVLLAETFPQVPPACVGMTSEYYEISPVCASIFRQIQEEYYIDVSVNGNLFTVCKYVGPSGDLVFPIPDFGGEYAEMYSGVHEMLCRHGYAWAVMVDDRPDVGAIPAEHTWRRLHDAVFSDVLISPPLYIRFPDFCFAVRCACERSRTDVRKILPKKATIPQAANILGRPCEDLSDPSSIFVVLLGDRW